MFSKLYDDDHTDRMPWLPGWIALVLGIGRRVREGR